MYEIQYDRTACERCSVLRKIKRSMYMHRRKDRASMDSAPECKARIWYELVLVCTTKKELSLLDVQYQIENIM